MIVETINIKFWDNEKYDYPIISIYKKDLKVFEEILKNYQKDEEYNFDDFIEILKEKLNFVEVIGIDKEIYF